LALAEAGIGGSSGRWRGALAEGLGLARQRRWMAEHPKLRAWLLALGLLLIPLWQWGLAAGAADDPDLPRKFHRTGNNKAEIFAYYHLLGLYPIGPNDGHQSGGEPRMYRPPFDDARAAMDWMQDRSRPVIMAHSPWFMDPGYVWVYAVDVLLGRKVSEARPIVGQAILFTAASMALFLAFWFARLEILGAATVLLLGSAPQLVGRVYLNENGFFASPVTVMLVMACVIPLCRESFRLPAWNGLLAALAGAIVALGQSIRGESIAGIGIAVVACLLLPHRPWRWRLMLVVVVLTAYALVAGAIQRHFVAAYERTSEVMIEHNRPVMLGYDVLHTTWHTIWAGLGDFGQGKGYGPYDGDVWAYVLPLARKLRIDVSHPVRAEHSINYARLAREKVLRDIATDPVWYAGVVVRRAARTVAETPPLRLAVGPWSASFAFPGWPLYLALLGGMAALALLRRGTVAVIALLWFGTTSMPLFVTTLNTLASESLVAYAAAAMIVAWLVEFGLSRTGYRTSQSPR